MAEPKKPTKAQIKELFAAHESATATEERNLRAYGLDVTRQWVGEGGYRLSDSVWDARQDVRDQIDRLLREAVASGEDALGVADKLEQYLDPALAPKLSTTGRYVRNQAPVIVTRSPGRGGMGSFSARRLARTEITRAHGAATIFAAERTPGSLGVKWSTSGSHPKPDECDEKASRDSGLGEGVYPPKDVPQYPSHPMCLCNLSQATTDDVDGLVNDLRAKYGLGVAEDATGRMPFTDAITLPDAEAAARALGVTSVNYGGEFTYTDRVGRARLMAANATNRALSNLVERGMSIPTRVQTIRDSGSTAIAYFAQRNDGVTLNIASSFWNNPQAGIRRMARDNTLVARDAHEIVVHELGHHQHSLISDVFKTARVLTAEEVAIASRVSRYAAVDQAEFVAEVFTGLVRGARYDEDVMRLYWEWEGPTV